MIWWYRLFFVWDSFCETKSPKTSLYLCMSSVKSQKLPTAMAWIASLIQVRSSLKWSWMKTNEKHIAVNHHFVCSFCRYTILVVTASCFADLLILSLRLYGWWLVVSAVSLLFFPVQSLESWVHGQEGRCADHIQKKEKTQIVIYLQQKAVGELGTSERWFVVILDE